MTLPDLKSRWTMSASCKAASASAIWRSSGRASCGAELAAAFEVRRERFALDVLHGEEDDVAVSGAVLAAVEDAADVLVGHAAGELNLAPEAGQADLVEGELRAECLEGDAVFQVEVSGFVDLAHPALAGESNDAEAAGDDVVVLERALVRGDGRQAHRLGFGDVEELGLGVVEGQQAIELAAGVGVVTAGAVEILGPRGRVHFDGSVEDWLDSLPQLGRHDDLRAARGSGVPGPHPVWALFRTGMYHIRVRGLNSG